MRAWAVWGGTARGGGWERKRERPYGALWSPMEPYGALWSLMEPYGALWSPMEPYGAFKRPPKDL